MGICIRDTWNKNLPPPPHKGSTPVYQSKHEDALVLQAKIDELESQNIVAKTVDLGINVKYASPCMLQKKNSAKSMPKEEYDKLNVKEKAGKNRFVLCCNKLCNYVAKKPATVTRVQDTIAAVGQYEYIITSDLTDSFYQRKIKQHLLPYMAFHSPFGHNYVLLRSPQGLLNQSEELELMLKVVLQEGVQGGWVRIHADNLYVMGRTYSEAVDRWERVLDTLEANNLKLTGKKTACFPQRLDLFGWTKEGRFLIPDPHRQNTLLTAKLPRTVKEL